MMSETENNWRSIIRLLSLDCLTQFWPELGLKIEEQGVFLLQSVSRLSYLVIQNGAENYYDADYSKIDESQKYFNNSISSLSSNPTFFSNVDSWISNSLQNLDDTYELYNIIGKLHYLYNQYSDVKPALDLSENCFHKLHQILKIYIVDGPKKVEELSNKHKKYVQTKWDKLVFKGGEAPEWDKEGFFLNPLDDALTIVKIRYMESFRGELLKTFNVKDIETIDHWVKNIDRS